MAGHSKWANIKRAKGATDAKRGKVFAKLSREVTVAAKLGGGDPDMNPRLRMVLLKCRAASMPKDNIDRAIQKATGGGADANFEELVYDTITYVSYASLVYLSIVPILWMLLFRRLSQKIQRLESTKAKQS